MVDIKPFVANVRATSVNVVDIISGNTGTTQIKIVGIIKDNNETFFITYLCL